MHRKLIAREICKSIKGKQVLEHISLELEEGNVYGFWGSFWSTQGYIRT